RTGSKRRGRRRGRGGRSGLSVRRASADSSFAGKGAAVWGETGKPRRGNRRSESARARQGSRVVGSLWFEPEWFMRSDIRYNNIIDNDEAREAQAAADNAPNLPAAEIDADKFYITQAYEKYTRGDHEVWRDLFDRRWTVLEQQVSRQFIEGMRILRLTRDRLPLLDDLTLTRDIEVAGGTVIKKGTHLDGINKFLKQQS